MLQGKCTLAKFGVDATENEFSKILLTNRVTKNIKNLLSPYLKPGDLAKAGALADDRADEVVVVRRGDRHGDVACVSTKSVLTSGEL